MLLEHTGAVCLSKLQNMTSGIRCKKINTPKPAQLADKVKESPVVYVLTEPLALREREVRRVALLRASD